METLAVLAIIIVAVVVVACGVGVAFLIRNENRRLAEGDRKVIETIA